MKQKNNCVFTTNKITDWLNSHGRSYRTNKPTYGNHYFEIILDKNNDTFQKNTVIVIKRNGSVMFNIDRRTKIVLMPFKQRILRRNSNYPNWLRIGCGHGQIEQFLTCLDKCNVDL